VSVNGLPREILDGGLVVAIDPGKVEHRVWVTDRGGVVGEPLSLPSSRAGLDRLEALVGTAPATFAIEATGALHRAWAAELERRRPGSLRLFAPSQTQAARTQLGTRRFKTDDRDCAALVWLARQGAGQPANESTVDALRAAVSHRRQLVLALKPLRQRLHDQLNALAPGLSAPKGHGRALALETSTGRAVLACAVEFAGRPPSVRSLKARADGRLRDATAAFWTARWRDCLPPPPDAALRAARMRRDLARLDALREDIAFVDGQIEQLLADSAGHILHPAGRLDHSGRGVRRPHPPRRALPEPRASLLGHRPGSRQLCILDRPPPRRDLTHRAARAPRRADRHRLGARPVRARLPAAPERTARPRQDATGSARRARSPRLPTLLANAPHPRALRRSALRSRQARPRAVTASELCRTTAQPSLPPARARRSLRRKRKPAARRRLISLPT
jgi:hypothetical protein